MTGKIQSQGTIRTTVPKQAPLQPTVKEEAPLKATPDSLKLSAPQAPLIEADLGISLNRWGSATVNGKVQLNKTFIERLIKLTFQGNSQISAPQIAYDPKQKNYQIQAKATWHGVTVPFSARLSAAEDANQAGFKLEELRVPVGNSNISLNAFKGFLAKELSKQLNNQGFTSQANTDQGIVSLDANSILAHIGAKPYYLRVDTEKTRLSVETLASGDIAVHLKTDNPVELPENTPGSDISIRADQEAITDLLKTALRPNYEVNQVTFREGGATIDGKADIPDVSAGLTLAKYLLIAISAAGGGGTGGMDAKPVNFLLDLDLDLDIKGQDLTITPSLKQAVPKLEEAAQKAGFPLKREGNSLKINLGTAFEQYGKLEGINISPRNANAKMRLDIDALIDNPVLKPPS